MKKYLVIDPDFDHEEFDTIEQARSYLESVFLDNGEYHPDTEVCKIYTLVETVKLEEVDNKGNYKYECEEDIPDGDNESEAWPYSADFDIVAEHKFVKV